MIRENDLLAVALRCCAERKLPARVHAKVVSEILGCTEEDITLLMRAGLLKPLGKPTQNAVKWFSAVEVLQLGADRAWLEAMTKTLAQYWRRKRVRRSGVSEPSGLTGASSRKGEGNAES